MRGAAWALCRRKPTKPAQPQFTADQLAALPAFAKRLVEARSATPPVSFAKLGKELGIPAAKYHFELAMRVLNGGAVPKADMHRSVSSGRLFVKTKYVADLRLKAVKIV